MSLSTEQGYPVGPRNPVVGPDFICIGMAKAGTRWLYDQLCQHPDFWMPPVKDWGYLKRTEPRRTKSIRKRQERWSNERWRLKAKSRFANRRPHDTRDLAFLEEAATTAGLEAYIALFRYKEIWLSGDITAGYSGLRPDTIALIARRLPQTRIILLVRDPVSRAWSHTSMLENEGKLPEGVLDSVQAYRAFLEGARSMGGDLFPTRVLARWRQYAPDLAFRYFLFDDLAREPGRVRQEILRHIGADPSKASGDLPPGYNAKANGKKLELREPFRKVLVDFFRDELFSCAEVFGGPAQEWPARYGL